MKKIIAIFILLVAMLINIPQVNAKGSFFNPVEITEVRARHILVKKRKDAVAIKKILKAGK